MRCRLLGVLALAACSAGCLNFSVGAKTEQTPTLADEITELKKLADRGTISHDEFEAGKYTLLQQYRRETLGNPAAAETQLAVFPEPVE